jgi:hypothetical protein
MPQTRIDTYKLIWHGHVRRDCIGSYVPFYLPPPPPSPRPSNPLACTQDTPLSGHLQPIIAQTLRVVGLKENGHSKGEEGEGHPEG